MKKERGNYKNFETQKSEYIQIRVTISEKELIRKKSEKEGLSLSDFIRQNALKGYVLTTSKEQETESNNSVDRRTIIGLATNLNQLTKHINSTHEIHSDLQACLKAITAIINKG